MANLPISVSINWKPFLVGFLLLAGFLYYFSGHINKVFRLPQSTKSSTMPSTGFLKFGDVDDAIFYQQITPDKPKLQVLFLHGQRFTSENWKNIKTLDFLSKKGYEVLAIDLPGFGKSKLPTPKTLSEKGNFLKEILTKVKYNNAVIVAPSMSGSFAFPFIFDGDNAKSLKGFVPIAPVSTKEYEDDKFKKLSLATMAVFGQNDNLDFVAGAREKLSLIPGAVLKTIDNAGHACYLDHPGEFHSLMEYFLEKLEKN